MKRSIHFWLLFSMVLLMACVEEEFEPIEAGVRFEGTTAIWAGYPLDGQVAGQTSEQDKQAIYDKAIDNMLSRGNDVFCNHLEQDNYDPIEDVTCHIQLAKKGITEVIPPLLEYIEQTVGPQAAVDFYDGVIRHDSFIWLTSHNKNLHSQDYAFANFMLVNDILYCKETKQTTNRSSKPNFLGCGPHKAGGLFIANQYLRIEDSPQPNDKKLNIAIAHEAGHLLIDASKLPRSQKVSKPVHLQCGEDIKIGGLEFKVTPDIYLNNCGQPDATPVDHIIPPYMCNLLLTPTDEAKENIKGAGGNITIKESNYEDYCD